MIDLEDLFVEERVIELQESSSDPLAAPSAVLPWAGYLAVVDNMQGNIKLYDWNGRLRRTLGRPGFGPGEFRAPAYAVEMPDGGLMIYDQATHEVTRLDSAGGFLSRSTSPVPWMGSLHRFGNGLVASGHSVESLGAAEPGVKYAPIHLLDTTGTVVRSLGEAVVEDRPELRAGGIVLSRPISDTLIVYGRISEAPIRLINPRSGTQRSVEGTPPGYTPPALPRVPIGEITEVFEWWKGQTALSGFLPVGTDRFAVVFSGPGSGDERLHTYTVLNARGERELSTRPARQFVRFLDTDRYFHLEVEEEGARLTLYRLRSTELASTER